MSISTKLEPLKLADEVEQRYIRYLKTTFYFKDAEFRRSFESALDSGHLVKGPYLEATPVYRKEGTTAADLARQFLGDEPDAGFAGALPSYSLYLHQQNAIRRVCQGRNVIVATGTGSGKTEAYLLPILFHLYKQRLAGQAPAGVRALVLYPMNALANDQRRRLGELGEKFKQGGSGFSFTFGRYTGEAPEREGDTYRKAAARLEDRLAGELVLRNEMRESPPDILLTNYSMLEYLLLRPKDSQLFDEGRGSTWHFLVLDEAHQYRGTKGMEMAMLVRRLKQRLKEGGLTGRLQCIATSASLGRGAQDRAGLANFARDLFDEPFDEEDVLVEETVDEPAEGSLDLTVKDYGRLGRGAAEQVFESLKGGEFEVDGGDRAATRFSLLQKDRRFVKLRRSLGKPRLVAELVDEVFPEIVERDRQQRLSEYVDLLSATKDPALETSLLSVRYHFFVRALDGAFIRYLPAKQVRLGREENAESPAAPQGRWFEVGLCQECGQHFFVGRRDDNGRLGEAIRDPSNDKFGVTFFRPVEAGPDSSADLQATKSCYLCLECGELGREGLKPRKPACGHPGFVRVAEEKRGSSREDQVSTCGACGYQGRDPVREVVHGNDGPNTVIAATLDRGLPEDRRKVLAFADNRQEAAFFAWFLDRTYQNLRDRNIIYSCLKRLAKPDGVAPGTLVCQVRDELISRNLVSPASDQEQRLSDAWKIVYREFCTEERRLSLEGVGLVRWHAKLPEGIVIPSILRQPPWSLADAEAKNLLVLLLDSFRNQAAVELYTDPGVSLKWSDLGLRAPRQQAVDLRPRKGVTAWDGLGTRRVEYLARLLARSGGRELSGRQRKAEAQQLLRVIWDELRKAGDSEPLLVRFREARRINPRWWRVALVSPRELFCCDTCGGYQAISIRGVCARNRCPGPLSKIGEAPDDLLANHYRRLYQEDLPDQFTCEEHTAQIDRELAAKFQEDFKAGRIHLLSCSTTFELGVDLEDLDVIFLRNVPPEPFNYAQRVGRAGRRAGHPGFALTYCRRRPHDSVHFQDPSRMLAGKTRPPVLKLTNEKIVLRHVAAVALSEFFRKHSERFGDVEKLFAELRAPTAVVDFETFLRHHETNFAEKLRAIVPERLWASWRDGSWIGKIASEHSSLGLAEEQASEDYRSLWVHRQSILDELQHSRGDPGMRRALDRADARADTIATENVISFLSRKAVIPKYGFPVDVVELDLLNQRGREVNLQRNLNIAVAEFAPGSKVVANKKLWKSVGLKTVPGRKWPRLGYIRCLRHGTFKRWTAEGPQPEGRCCQDAQQAEYIDPIFGFTTDGSSSEPQSRPERLFTTRPYFSGPRGDQPEQVDVGGVAKVRKASPGYLVVLCEGRKGQGFFICRDCGAGSIKKENLGTKKKPDPEHKTPLGRGCRGQLVQSALGHEFLTDVLRIEFRVASGGADIWFAYSLGYALLSGAAEVLEIPPGDLNVTVKGGEGNGVPAEIVLYDDDPGGAGLVAQLDKSQIFRDCLDEARKRVDGHCGCPLDEKSCDRCLRSYTNQFAHTRLARGPVYSYLDRVLKQWRDHAVAVAG